MSDTTTTKTDVNSRNCRFCDETVDADSNDEYEYAYSAPVHTGCIANHCYEHREKVATTRGVIEIKPVTVTKEIGNAEKVIDSYWQTECPVCYQTHSTDTQRENIRSELIDTACSCCDAEWLPPTDWIDNCNVCNNSHRESDGCRPIIMRTPFPDPETHTYNCSECEWSGSEDEFNNFKGRCPGCGSTAIEAIPIATDGGVNTQPILNNDVDPNRLAGREYEVVLSYTVEYRVPIKTGPEEQQAVEKASTIANPAGCVDVNDWELVHTEVETIDDIWMDDPDAPKAAEWLDEPHTPSEETYWDDTKHFDEVTSNGESS